MRIPFVASWPEDSGIHAAFALSLAAIRPDASMVSPRESIDPDKLWHEAHLRNVRLMHLMSRWPHTVCWELHILSSPSLDLTVPGHNEITLVCHVHADDIQGAVEAALADSIKIDAILKI